MILADTSLWVDFLDRGQPALRTLLERGEILIHPFIVGEFAMGTPRHRARILADLNALPRAAVANHDEVIHFVESQKLYGMGIGFIDAHLLASAKLTPHTLLWTNDVRLRAAAQKVGLAYQTP